MKEMFGRTVPRGRLRWAILVLAVCSAWFEQASALVIDNDVPVGTLGHWSVDVFDGGQSDSASVTANRQASADVFTAEVLFGYYSLVDPGNDGGGFQLSGSAPVADLADPDTVSSSGSFLGVAGNTIHWSVRSSIADGEPVMVSSFTFTAETGTLGALRFLQYMDEDIQGFADDVFFTRGSVATNDLQLFSVDNSEVYGLSHSGAVSAAAGLANGSFAGWAAAEWDNILPGILGGGQVVAASGVITNLASMTHPQIGAAYGPADIVSVLAWDVDPDATQATIVTTLGGIPDVTIVQCGNGTVEGSEECDDGNADSSDGCTNVCTFTCGDGSVAGSEECDDGNLTPGDGCSAACTVEICGDGSVAGSEECDDGNTVNGDCCDATCHHEALDSPCSDENACTQADRCDGAGACQPGTPVVCTPLDDCHVAGVCAPDTGTCSNPAKPDGFACDDGDVCTQSDRCVAGACTASGSGGDTDGDKYCDAWETLVGCNPNDFNEIPPQGNATPGRGRTLMAYSSPTQRRIIVGSDPACTTNGVCGSNGLCTAGKIGDPCDASSDCNQVPNTCRIVVNYPDVADLVLRSVKLNREDFAGFSPVTPGCARKVQVFIDPTRSASRLALKAEGTVEGRRRRERDRLYFRR